MDTENRRFNGHKYIYAVMIAVIIMLQFFAALFFGMQKKGCHYDEYYSYYSSNVSAGLNPTDNGWMRGSELADEFMVLKGEGFNYGMVKLMQNYDVHPPLYYYILHTVCSLTPGVFSLWQGLAVNLFFHLLTLVLLWLICKRIYAECGAYGNVMSLTTVALYGFSPAILSGVMFIRMYVLLSFLCLLTIYMHVKYLDKPQENRQKKDFIALCVSGFVLTFLGTQTHYYFYVLMFFTAGYMTLHHLFKKKIKGSIIYAASVLFGVAASILYYPAVLSHIFRGYRGTEATEAFFDTGNITERGGLFIGLLDEYLLPHCFYILLLVIFIGFVTLRYLGTRHKEGSDRTALNPAIGLLLVVTIGYFAVVLKTALTNAEEAVRYEMPVYGLIILLMIYAAGSMLQGLIKNEKALQITGVAVISVLLICEIYALSDDKVLFLYKDDVEGYGFAAEHHDDTVVYIYNPVNQWMIWDDSCELMNYDKIFFISAGNSDEITDETVKNADHLYVYAVRSDEAKEQLESINDLKDRESEPFVLRQLQYADLYELK